MTMTLYNDSTNDHLSPIDIATIISRILLLLVIFLTSILDVAFL